MERTLLSLKTIYKLLVNSDFPLFSFSVISEKNRKGLTLLKFWQSQMIYEFHSLPCGQMIWRSEGKRNRYISSLCNRTPGMTFCTDYARELASQASAKTVMKQAEAFIDFLQSRSYQHDILITRIEALLPLLQRDDPCCNERILAHLRQLLHFPKEMLGSGAEGERFHAACLLTFMMLYAAAGDAMADPALFCLREIGSVEALWSLYHQQKHADRDDVSFVTTLREICGNDPLPPHRYFGREEALFDLREMILTGKKCLISGIGGVGKTELARQIIRHCRDEKLVDSIAIVQYNGCLSNSFSRVCASQREADDADTLRRMLASLSSAQCGHTLLVIDNMNASVEEDPDLTLIAALPCSVLITSRLRHLDGFETYPLAAPNATSGMLIFRDNYGKPLTAQDRAVLTSLLSEESLCHTLTLRLMGKAARARGWSIAELRDALQKNGISLSWQEDERSIRLDQLYHQLYSFHQLPAVNRRIIEFFSLLPHESFSLDFLLRFFPDLFDPAAQSTRQLFALAERGWLESDGVSFSMHPLIARCLQRKHLSETYLLPMYLPVIRYIAEHVSYDADDTQLYADPTLRRCRSLINAVSHQMEGPVSHAWMRALLLANFAVMRACEGIPRMKDTLDRLMKRCTEADDELRVLECTVLGRCRIADAEIIRGLYAAQKQKLTIARPLFLSFCVFCGDSPSLYDDFATARSMLEEALAPDAAIWQTATAYYHLSSICEVSGNFELQESFSSLGARYVAEHPACSASLRFHAIFAHFAFCVKFGRQEAASVCNHLLSSMVSEDLSPSQRATYHQCAGTYELQYGDLDTSLHHYRQAEAILPECFDAGVALLMLHGQIAIVLQRLKRYEEALALYRDILRRCCESGLSGMRQRFSNNLGVLYLDMDNPHAALEPLQTALTLGRPLGSIALAEALRNLARAYGMLGDTALEKQHLLEAVPLLEQVYGTEHPRATASRQRLDALLAPES